VELLAPSAESSIMTPDLDRGCAFFGNREWKMSLLVLVLILRRCTHHATRSARVRSIFLLVLLELVVYRPRFEPVHPLRHSSL
jgi:hypothetical protein